MNSSIRFKHLRYLVIKNYEAFNSGYVSQTAISVYDHAKIKTNLTSFSSRKKLSELTGGGQIGY